MKAKKYILTACSLLMACGMLVGCSKQEPKETVKVATCKSTIKDNIRWRWDFTLADDGKTITNIKWIHRVNEDYLKYIMKINKDFKGSSLDEVYELYRNELQYEYGLLIPGNENLVWLKSQLETNDEKHEAALGFTFLTDSKDLDMTDKDTVDYLSWYGVQNFYNKDEKAFIYDEKGFKSNPPINYITDASCSINDVEKK